MREEPHLLVQNKVVHEEEEVSEAFAYQQETWSTWWWWWLLLLLRRIASLPGVCYQDVPIQEGLHAVEVGVFITMQYSRGGGP
jgi:hypothetical protein